MTSFKHDGILRILIDNYRLTDGACSDLLQIDGMYISKAVQLCGSWHEIRFRLFPFNSTSSRGFPNMDILVSFKHPGGTPEDHRERADRIKAMAYRAIEIPVISHDWDWRNAPKEGSTPIDRICNGCVEKMWGEIEKVWKTLVAQNATTARSL